MSGGCAPDGPLPCRSASILVSTSVQPSFQAETGLGIRVAPHPSPFSLGPRPVSSPPQVELILLPSPSRYLIAEEPELVPPWVCLLCRQDQCCFLGSAVATGIHSPHRRDIGVGVGGRPGELSAQEVGCKLFSLRGWESWLRCLAISTLGKG